MQNTFGNIISPMRPVPQENIEIIIAKLSFSNNSLMSCTIINTQNNIHKNHNWLGLVHKIYFSNISFSEKEYKYAVIGTTQINAQKQYGISNLFTLINTNGTTS